MRVPYGALPGVAICADILLVTSTSVVSGVGYHALWLGQTGQTGEYLGIAAVVSALLIPMLHSRGLYGPTELLNFWRQIRHVAVAWFSVLMFLAGVAFSLKMGETLSRGATMIFACSGIVALALNRIVFQSLFRWAIPNRLLLGKRIILIAAKEFETIAKAALTHCGFQIQSAWLLPSASAESCKIHLQNILTSLRGSDAEEVIIAGSWRDRFDIVRMVEELRVIPLPIKYIPDGATSALFTRPRQSIGPTVAIELRRAPLSNIERFAKRGFDITLSTLGLILLWPILAGAAVAIKLDGTGPVLFRQARNGFNGQSFRIFKFRTMSVLEDGLDVPQAKRDDPRVTRVGSFLRRTSIDELPQLLNVIRGEMSLVGPRPHAVAHNNFYDEVIRDYALRHHVKPGLTGWAQVNGYRGETPTLDSMKKRVLYDLWYVDHWSLWLDIVILTKTFNHVVRGRNSY